jgi:hypothetical protein
LTSAKSNIGISEMFKHLATSNSQIFSILIDVVSNLQQSSKTKKKKGLQIKD